MVVERKLLGRAHVTIFRNILFLIRNLLSEFLSHDGSSSIVCSAAAWGGGVNNGGSIRSSSTDDEEEKNSSEYRENEWVEKTNVSTPSAATWNWPDGIV